MYIVAITTLGRRPDSLQFPLAMEPCCPCLSQPHLVTNNLGDYSGNRGGQGEVRGCSKESACADHGNVKFGSFKKNVPEILRPP